jgi:phenol 2-monooxygenase
LARPGTKRKVRLERVTRNFAKFWIVVFAENPVSTHFSLANLERYIGATRKVCPSEAIGRLTISAVAGIPLYEPLGMNSFGIPVMTPAALHTEYSDSKLMKVESSSFDQVVSLEL